MSGELKRVSFGSGIDPPPSHLLLGLQWFQSHLKGTLIKRKSGTARSTDRRTSLMQQWRCFSTGHHHLVPPQILLQHPKTLLCRLFQKWANADLNGKFKLPMKNEFIPTNFEIYPLEKESPSVPTVIKASAPAVLFPSATTLANLALETLHPLLPADHLCCAFL